MTVQSYDWLGGTGAPGSGARGTSSAEIARLCVCKYFFIRVYFLGASLHGDAILHRHGREVCQDACCSKFFHNQFWWHRTPTKQKLWFFAKHFFNTAPCQGVRYLPTGVVWNPHTRWLDEKKWKCQLSQSGSITLCYISPEVSILNYFGVIVWLTNSYNCILKPKIWHLNDDELLIEALNCCCRDIF